MATTLEGAVAYALSRDVVLSEEYYSSLTAIQRRQAVSIAGLAEIEQVRYVLAQVNSALINGQSFEDFQRNVNLVDIDLPRYRLKTIYQTNIQSAYSHGRWIRQQEDKKNKPYLMYVTKNDSLVRPEHQILNRIVRPIGDVFWFYNTPPLDYNCRCRTRGVTPEEAERMGITLAVDLPPNQAANGFGHSPELYNDAFDNVVRDRLSQVMLENYKQSSQVASISGRISAAATKILDKPKKSLSSLVTAAKKLLGL